MEQQSHSSYIINSLRPFTHTTVNVKKHKKYIQREKIPNPDSNAHMYTRVEMNNKNTKNNNNNKQYSVQETPKPEPVHHNRILSNISHAITTPDGFYCPTQSDSLFWCVYMIQKGELEYEMLNKGKPISMSILINLKIACVEEIRKTYKENVKPYKLSTLENIETSLVHTPNINITTAASLCAGDKHNLCFISSKQRFFYLLECNPETTTWYIIKCEDNTSNNNNNNNNKNRNGKHSGGTPLYSYKQVNQNELTEYKPHMLQITNLNNPLKSISSYKLDDLLNMSITLQLPTINTITNKQLKKKDLYEQVSKIVQPNVFSAA